MAGYFLSARGLNMANNLDFSQKTSAGSSSNSLDFSSRVTDNNTQGLMSRQFDLNSGSGFGSAGTGNVPAKAYSIISDKIGVNQATWDLFRRQVGKIESQNDYSVKGGYNNHYDGRYQLGKAAKTDAATLLGYSLNHDPTSRKEFRESIKKQEEAFAAYTAKNHGYLMSKSKEYRGLSTEEKLAALAYAHNQGWAGAKKWLATGTVGADAFGTKGTKYSNAIKDALAKVGIN